MWHSYCSHRSGGRGSFFRVECRIRGKGLNTRIGLADCAPTCRLRGKRWQGRGGDGFMGLPSGFPNKKCATGKDAVMKLSEKVR